MQGRKRKHSGGQRRSPHASANLGNTGLSEEDADTNGDGSSDGSSSSSDSDTSDLEGDEVDIAVAAFLSGRAPEESDSEEEYEGDGVKIRKDDVVGRGGTKMERETELEKEDNGKRCVDVFIRWSSLLRFLCDPCCAPCTVRCVHIKRSRICEGTPSGVFTPQSSPLAHLAHLLVHLFPLFFLEHHSVRGARTASLSIITAGSRSGQNASASASGNIPPARNTTVPSELKQVSAHHRPIEGTRDLAADRKQQPPHDSRRLSVAPTGAGAADASMAAAAALVKPAGDKCRGGMRTTSGEILDRAGLPTRLMSATGGGIHSGASCSGATHERRSADFLSPIAQSSRMLMTPADAPITGCTKLSGIEAGKRKHDSCGDSHPAEDRTMRTPVRTPPESGSSSFLYEAENAFPALLGSPDVCSHHSADESSDAVPAAGSLSDVGPSFEACHRASPRGRNYGDGDERDVFARGAAAMAEFSSVWRRSRCFSFVLGSRGVHWVGDGHTGAGRGCAYRRSWEALASKLSVAPYTVPSAGESFIPLSRNENVDA